MTTHRRCARRWSASADSHASIPRRAAGGPRPGQRHGDATGGRGGAHDHAPRGLLEGARRTGLDAGLVGHLSGRGLPGSRRGGARGLGDAGGRGGCDCACS